MKRKILRITTALAVTGTIVMILASNKAKINKAAHPVKEEKLIPVKIHEVKQDSFNAAFTLTGTTVPAREVKIASEVQGKLVRLYIENGDFVRAGQVIGTLDASVFTAQLNSIETSIAKAELDIDRYTKLIEMGGASSMQLENVVLQHRSYIAQRKEILQQMEHMQIRAPFSGKIENVNVELGSFVTFGTVLSQLIDNSSLKINVYLSEQEAFKVNVGDRVTINSAVLSEAKNGKISAISDKADASGKFLTEIAFENTHGTTLKAGILADVHFSLQSVETGLSVPVSALLSSAKEAKVFVVNGNKAQLRPVKTGVITTDKVQVLEGLRAGDKVVISGQLNLENGTTISINQ